MRPNELFIQGLAAFREPQTIDFRSLDDLFVIVGPTGAGKSTILDALSFALFGELPRAKKNQRKDFITLGAPEANVRLRFEVAGEEYEVARKLSHTKSQMVTLHRVEGENRTAEATEGGVGDVDRRIEEILGFDYEAFTKAVLLPQGDFALFLRGASDERRKLLARLLDAEKYVRAGSIARERADAADHEVTFRQETLSADWSDATEERRQAFENEAIGLRAREEELRGAQKALADAEARAAALRRDVAVERERERVLGGAVDELTGLADAADSLAEEAARTALDLAQATERAAEARAALETADADLALALDEVGDERALARLATAAETVAQVDHELATLAARQSDAEAALATAAAALAAAVRAQQEAALNETAANAAYETARERVQAAAAAARSVAERKAAEGTLETAREEAVAIAEQAKEAHDALAAAIAAADEAERQYAEIRIAHEAQALRQNLHQGEPCPVCTQVVSVLPPPGPGHDALAAAQTAAERAKTVRKSAEKAEREVSLRLTRAEAAAEQAEARFTALPPAAEVIEDATDAAEQAQAEAIAQLEATRAARRTADANATTQSAVHARAQSSVEEIGRQKSELEQRRERGHELLAVRFPELPVAEAGARITADQERLGALRGEATRLRAACDASTQAEGTARGARVDYESRARRTQERLIALRARLAGAPEAASERPDAAEARHLLSWVTERMKEAKAKGYDAEAQAQTVETDAVSRARELNLGDVTGAGITPLLDALNKAIRAAGEKAAQAEASAKATAQRIALRAEHEAVIAEKRRSAEQYRRLSNELRADRFIKFVLEESFQDLAVRASEELRRVSSGRYSLEASGYDFMVVDHANADEKRSVVTLSGGESFLASLSLALAFSGSIRDIAGDALGSRLESVFIDEGFGSLDPDVLDIVADGLERVQEERRRVGIITHVPALAARIPSGLRVEPGEVGSRVVLRT